MERLQLLDREVDNVLDVVAAPETEVEDETVEVVESGSEPLVEPEREPGSVRVRESSLVGVSSNVVDCGRDWEADRSSLKENDSDGDEDGVGMWEIETE